jgi:AcrR family transcriptional regulator
VSGADRSRLPAAARRVGIIEAADVEFAANGLAGTRLEAIAGRAGISHPRIVQMFGSKQKLFLEVVHAAFDKIEEVFERAEPTLVALGAAYVRLLQSERTVGLVVLQGYAAAADETVRKAVRRRHLGLIHSITRLTGADALQVRTFFATGLVQTISTALELPGRRADTSWSAWILELADPAGRVDRDGQSRNVAEEGKGN